jgi:hypothetical protein
MLYAHLLKGSLIPTLMSRLDVRLLMTSITEARKVKCLEYPLNSVCLLFAELAQDELTADGYDVLGGYVSPVNDAYGKKVRTAFLQSW